MKIDVSYLKKLLGAFADSDKAYITLSEIEDLGIIIVDVEPLKKNIGHP
ncbi:hypothetical protein [Photobacterium iliopiscarium]|nr:hypothetical protein [Photobacterium iliopiscarium]MCD9488771.1 hypothetical protein [Photobacterium iliopiscarium]MCF2245479.1 hypothetical protein [Photobacterium iliopiscarium]